MPGERLSMRKIREVLRLRFGQGLSQRAIGQSLRLSVGAVNAYLSRSRMAGLGWPLPAEFDDAQLETLLYPPPPAVATERRPVPDWAVVHRELRRPNVTLALLWEEYRTGPGAQDGFGYSWFCDLYREWVCRLKPTLRQVHTAGERVYVDFAGHTMEVIDGATGEIRRAEIFVAVLGASSYTYAEAVWSQSLPDWIAVHVGMLAFLGGVPRQLVSDNLRAGITRACFYDRWSTAPTPTWRRTTALRRSSLRNSGCARKTWRCASATPNSPPAPARAAAARPLRSRRRPETPHISFAGNCARWLRPSWEPRSRIWRQIGDIGANREAISAVAEGCRRDDLR